MLTVALIGPDGSGKSTLAAELVRRLPVPSVTLYMGVNPDESTVRSPLARLATTARRGRGPRHDAGPPPRPDEASAVPGQDQTLLRRAKRSLRSVARAVNLITDELYRQRVIAGHRRAGRVVILDRDFWADYRMHDVDAGGRSLGRRLHGTYLEHRYRKPDLYVYLDAPAEVLFARKGEGTVELLRARQHDYRALAPLAPRFEVVDVDRPLDDVVGDLVDLVTGSLPDRNG